MSTITDEISSIEMDLTKDPKEVVKQLDVALDRLHQFRYESGDIYWLIEKPLDEMEEKIITLYGKADDLCLKQDVAEIVLEIRELCKNPKRTDRKRCKKIKNIIQVFHSHYRPYLKEKEIVFLSESIINFAERMNPLIPENIHRIKGMEKRLEEVLINPAESFFHDEKAAANHDFLMGF
ncbi:MAG: hypothetical protein L0207_05305 [Chlamydiae bacterium]|nr:hypothetical protein [Chlamydiota bacterium]